MTQTGWVTSIQDNPDQLIISSKGRLPLINKVILTICAIIIGLIILGYSLDMGPENRPIFLLLVFIPMVIGLGGGLWITKNFNKGTGTNTQLVLDKKNKILSANSENFSVKNEEIQAITIVEDTVVLAKVPRLRLKLKDGEKTILLNFESYTKAQEAKSALEKYL